MSSSERLFPKRDHPHEFRLMW